MAVESGQLGQIKMPHPLAGNINGHSHLCFGGTNFDKRRGDNEFPSKGTGKQEDCLFLYKGQTELSEGSVSHGYLRYCPVEFSKLKIQHYSVGTLKSTIKFSGHSDLLLLGLLPESATTLLCEQITNIRID